jgi:hypothetical protein
VPFVCTEQEHGVQLEAAVMVTPPATLVSGVGQLPGQPSDGVGPFSRTMGPCQPVGTETHVPVQPLLLDELEEVALDAGPLDKLVLDDEVLEELVLEVDAAAPIPELAAVLLLSVPPLPAAPPTDDDESPAVPVLDA